MKRAGQIAILRLPNVDLAPGKPRPVLLLASVPGPYDDWLVCMISTQLRHEIAGFDEIIDANSDDFELAGIKVPSVIRIARSGDRGFGVASRAHWRDCPGPAR